MIAEGVAHHVTQRGNARRVVFDSDADRVVYLHLLRQYSILHQCALVGYCLMSNHMHLIAVPGRADSLPVVLRDVHGRYATYLNGRQSASGHVWQGRYFSCPLDAQHLWAALRYVERNPVRAGMAGRAEEYEWSSAGAHCGDSDKHGLLDFDFWRGDTSVAWVPDGNAVLFSRDGGVWTYDVGSRRTSLLFREGTNPSCSPNGQWIAYRDPNGYAVIASRLSTGAKRASHGPIDGYVHWSPDSAYYFVDEKVPRSSPQRCPFGNCFVVYRLGDGSRLELQGSDRKDSFFGWLRGPWSVR